MPTPTCPKCRRTIPPEDINVAQDVAYCRACNLSHRLSDLTTGGDMTAQVDVNHPPQGAWFKSDGSGTVIGATNRNLAAAFGMLFFAVFWNGIVSVFVSFAIAGTLRQMHVPLPAWFPNPGMNGSGGMSLGMTIFLWLFLTPFIAVGLFVAGTCLSSLFGRTEVRIESSRGTAFTGIGGLGWKRSFDASQVRAVRLFERRNNQGQDSFSVLIELRDGKQVKLGSLLTNERRQFMLGALTRALIH